MPKRSVYKDRTSAWVLVGALITLAIGIGLLWGSESLDNHPILRSLSVNMGGLIVASVALGAIWELLGKRRFVEEIFEAASVSEAVRSAKVSVITTHFQEGVDWTSLMEGARELDLFVAAGRTWRSRLDNSLKINRLEVKRQDQRHTTRPDQARSDKGACPAVRVHGRKGPPEYRRCGEILQRPRLKVRTRQGRTENLALR